MRKRMSRKMLEGPMFAAIKKYFGQLLEVPEAVSPARYRSGG